MPLSEKTKNILFALFAISPIIQRCGWAAVVGFLVFVIGYWQQLDWLKVIGIILAAPVIWAYAVLLFVYVPYLVFDSVRRSLNRNK